MLAGPGSSVAEVMRRHFIALAPSDTLLEAESLMRVARLRSLSVVREGALVGVLSYGELVRWSLSPEADPRPLRRRLRETKVASVMAAKPGIVTPQAPLEEAAARLVDRSDGYLSVVDAPGASPQLVGILTEMDLLRAAYGTSPPEA
jgi:CBS domain-containing protein